MEWDYWKNEQPYGSEGSDDPEINAYINDPNAVLSIPDLEHLFADYEGNSDTFSERCFGFGAVTVEICSHLWKKAGHRTDVISCVDDEIYSGESYWMLGTVYPWYKGEFDSMEDAEKAIRSAFPFEPVNLDKHAITNSD